MLERAASSGLSLQAFAKSVGVQVERLYQWRKRLRQPSAKTTTPRSDKPVQFVALPLRTDRKDHAMVEVQLPSGLVLRVDDSMDPARFKAWIAALRDA